MNDNQDLLKQLESVMQTGVTSRDQANDLLVRCYNVISEIKPAKTKRTHKQNASLWTWLGMLATALNDAGYDRIKVLKALRDTPEVEIPNDKDSLYDEYWMKIQKAMYEQYEGSSELDTTEISKVYEVANRHSVKVFGISIPWPSLRG